MSRDLQKIKCGDSVRLADGTMHEISSIQHVHNRYQLVGVSGWQFGIESLELEQPGSAYRHSQDRAAADSVRAIEWSNKAAAEKERADKAEARERELVALLKKLAPSAWNGGEQLIDKLLASLYPKEETK